jgi:hypothetical protein
MKSLILFLLVVGLAGGLMMVGCGKKEPAPPPEPEGLQMKPPEGMEEKMEEAEKAAEEAGSEMKEAVEGSETQ